MKPHAFFLSFLYELLLNYYKVMKVIDPIVGGVEGGAAAQSGDVLDTLTNTLLTTQNNLLIAHLDLPHLKSQFLMLHPNNYSPAEMEKVTYQQVIKDNQQLFADLPTFFASRKTTLTTALSALPAPTAQVSVETAVGMNAAQAGLSTVLEINSFIADVLMEVDVVRRKYWLWRQIQITEVLQGGDYQKIMPSVVTPGAQWKE